MAAKAIYLRGRIALHQANSILIVKVGLFAQYMSSMVRIHLTQYVYDHGVKAGFSESDCSPALVEH